MSANRGPKTAALASMSLRLGAAALLVLVCVGCPGTLQDPGRFQTGASTASCPDVAQDVLVPTCGTMSCHSAAVRTQGLDLVSPNLASRLVGRPATEGPGLLIDPVSPFASVLYTKLSSTPPFGVRMPFAKPALDAATIACVLDWITAQAEPDGGAISGGAADGLAPVDAQEGDGTMPPPEASMGNDAATPPKDAQGGDGTMPPLEASTGRDAATSPQETGSSPMDAAKDANTSPPDASVVDSGSSSGDVDAASGSEEASATSE